MKVTKQQTAESRHAILEAAARLFRERGFDAVTVKEIMEAAGLTHGAFYGYFASKDDLVAKSFAHVFAGIAAKRARAFKSHAAAYLSAEHRDDVASSCLFSTLGTEAVRASADTRHAMTASMRDQIEKLSETAPGATAAERRRSAIAGWSAMVGAVMLARIADDPELSDEILRETRLSLTR